VELEVDTAAVDALDTAAALVSELIDEAGVDRGRVLAAGMGLPGPIDRESGRVHSQPILPGWVALDPAAEMEERRDLYFRRRFEVYGEWIRIMEETTKGNAEGTITVASVG